MGTNLEVYGSHPKCGTFFETMVRDLGPPYKNCSNMSFFSFHKGPQKYSTIETKISSPC
jgi:hypothetical protein